MNLRDRSTRIWLGISLAATVLLASFLWFNWHRDEGQKSVLSRIHSTANVGIIRNAGLLEAFKSKKIFRLPDDDSIPGLLSTIKSPLEMGIDPLVNLIWFQNANQQGGQLVVNLNNRNAFSSWLKEGPGTLWEASVSQVEDATVWRFKDKTFAFVFNDHFALYLTHEEESETVINSFFKEGSAHVELLPLEFLNQEDLAVFRFARPTNFFAETAFPITINGVFGVQLSDHHIHIYKQSSMPSREVPGEITFSIDANNVASNAMRSIRDFLQISTSDYELLLGGWSMRWLGTESRAITYTTFEFDDNFNKLEVQKTKSELIPKLKIVFEAIDSAALNSFLIHLQKLYLIKENQLKVGPFWYSFVRNGKILCIGDDASATEKVEFENHGTSITIDVKPLFGDLESLGFPFPITDSIVLNNLSFISIRNSQAVSDFTFEVNNESSYHIGLVLKRLFTALNFESKHL